MTLKLLHQQGTQQGTFYWLEQVTCTRLKSMGRGHTLLPQKDSNGNGQGDIFIYRRGKKKLGPNHMIMGASLATQLVKVCFQCGRPGFDPWVGKIPWRGKWLPTPVFWPGEFHGIYSSPGGCQVEHN